MTTLSIVYALTSATTLSAHAGEAPQLASMALIAVIAACVSMGARHLHLVAGAGSPSHARPDAR